MAYFDEQHTENQESYQTTKTKKSYCCWPPDHQMLIPYFLQNILEGSMTSSDYPLEMLDKPQKKILT